MEVETAYTLNPDIHAYNGDGGYGLVQWTPGSKLRNWAQSNGLNFKTNSPYICPFFYIFPIICTTKD